MICPRANNGVQAPFNKLRDVYAYGLRDDWARRPANEQNDAAFVQSPKGVELVASIAVWKEEVKRCFFAKH